MKKVILLVLLTITCNILAGDYSTTMAPVMSKGEDIVKYIENELNLEVVRLEYDILRTTKTTTRILSEGWTYTICAFGDFRFKDIDIKVYRNIQGDWQLINSDNDASAIALVKITPPYEGEYLIEISAYSFEPGYDVGHYGLIIAHE